MSPGRSAPSAPGCPWPGKKPPVHCVTLLELGVNAGVVLGLATALVLIRRGAGMRET